MTTAIDLLLRKYNGGEDIIHPNVNMILETLLNNSLGGYHDKNTVKRIFEAKAAVEICNHDNKCVLYGIALHRLKYAVENCKTKCKKKKAKYENLRRQINRMKNNKEANMPAPVKSIVVEIADRISAINDDNPLSMDNLGQLVEILRENDPTFSLLIIDGDKMVSTHGFTITGSIQHLLYYSAIHENAERQADNVCTLVKVGNHVHFVTKLPALLSTGEVCLKCMTTFKKASNHSCRSAESLVDSANPAPSKRRLRDEHANTTNRPIDKRIESSKDKGKCTKSVWWDVETIVTGVHKVNVLNWSLYTHPDVEATLVDQGGIVLENENDISPVHAFLKMLLSEKRFKGSNIYAHYGGKYDNRFLLKAANECHCNAEHLFFNSALIEIKIRKNDLRFRDSFRMVPAKASKFAEMFGLKDGKKGDYPFLFNTHENLHYEGEMPDLKYWDLKNKLPSDAKRIESWHRLKTGFSKWKGGVAWDNYKEITEYCKQDVKIIAEGMLAFRKFTIQAVGVDPFQYLTLASCAKDVYTNKFMTAETDMHVEPSQKTYSMAQFAWTSKIEDELGYPLLRNHNLLMHKEGREERLEKAGAIRCGDCHKYMSLAEAKKDKKLYWAQTCCRPPRLNFCRAYDEDEDTCDKEALMQNRKLNYSTEVNVDAFDPKTNTIYEYDGCHVHGCILCSAGKAYPDHEKKRSDTLARHKRFSEAGYNVVAPPACTIKGVTQEHRDGYIHPRMAMKGGKTNVFRTITELENLPPGSKIRYLDVVSLYPSCTAFDAHPHGKPVPLTNKTLDNLFQRRVDESNKDFLLRVIEEEKFIGMFKVSLKMKTAPPTVDLVHHIHILPTSGERLDFDGKDKVKETYTSVELAFALKQSGRNEQVEEVTEIHGAIQYKEIIGPHQDYTCTWLRLKWISNGKRTQEECDEFNSICVAQGFKMKPVVSEETSSNPGLKQVAKLYLNSLWGKSAQQEYNTTTLTCYNGQQVYNAVIGDPDVINFRIMYEGEHYQGTDLLSYVEIKTEKKDDFKTPSNYSNSAFASFVTANARVRLYKMLLYLHPSQVIYCDTDSVIYWVDPNDKRHMDPETSQLSAGEFGPSPPVEVGTSLGQWETETDF